VKIGKVTSSEQIVIAIMQHHTNCTICCT